MAEVSSGITVGEVVVAAEPAAWAAAGFTVDGDGACRLGTIRVRLAGAEAGRGIVGWSLHGGVDPARLDGLPTVAWSAGPSEPARHPNGALRIDHVVAFTPDLDRTVGALERAGLELRRGRDERLPGGGLRQAFFRLGEVILEAIEQPAADGSPSDPAKPARLWGLALLTDDLAATAAHLGDALGAARDAIQPGRRIATARGSAGLGAPLAFITPPRR